MCVCVCVCVCVNPEWPFELRFCIVAKLICFTQNELDVDFVCLCVFVCVCLFVCVCSSFVHQVGRPPAVRAAAQAAHRFPVSHVRRSQLEDISKLFSPK